MLYLEALRTVIIDYGIALVVLALYMPAKIKTLYAEAMIKRGRGESIYMDSGEKRGALIGAYLYWLLFLFLSAVFLIIFIISHDAEINLLYRIGLLFIAHGLPYIATARIMYASFAISYECLEPHDDSMRHGASPPQELTIKQFVQEIVKNWY